MFSDFCSLSSVHCLESSIFHLLSSVLSHFTVLQPPSSVFRPPFFIFCSPSSVVLWPLSILLVCLVYSTSFSVLRLLYSLLSTSSGVKRAARGSDPRHFPLARAPAPRPDHAHLVDHDHLRLLRPLHQRHRSLWQHVPQLHPGLCHWGPWLLHGAADPGPHWAQAYALCWIPPECWMQHRFLFRVEWWVVYYLTWISIAIPFVEKTKKL